MNTFFVLLISSIYCWSEKYKIIPTSSFIFCDQHGKKKIIINPFHRGCIGRGDKKKTQNWSIWDHFQFGCISPLKIHLTPLPLQSLTSHSSLRPPSSLNHLHPSSPLPADPVPWPARAGQLQLWPAVRRLRQRLSATPTGSQWCLAVVLGCEWRVQSARRGGEPPDALTLAWACPFPSRGQRGGPVLAAPPAPPGHHRYCCNSCH